MSGILSTSSSSMLDSTLAAWDAASANFANAAQNRAGGLANLAARAAIARIQKAQKAKNAAALKQTEIAQRARSQAAAAKALLPTTTSTAVNIVA